MKPAALIPFVFAISGVVMMSVPTRSLLKWDRKTGYFIYKTTLASTGDEQKALRNANVFYKLFGLFFVLFGTSIGLILVFAG